MSKIKTNKAQGHQTKEFPLEEVPFPQQNINRSKTSGTKFSITDVWYKTIIQSATEGFFLLDLVGNILDVNDVYCHMIGYSRDELLTCPQ